LLYWWVAQKWDCVGIVGLVNAEWLSSDETLLPVMVIFGGTVDPLRSVRAHVMLEGHGVVIQPILSRRDEEDTTVICIVLLLLRC
jgi:hypothetical protein